MVVEDEGGGGGRGGAGVIFQIVIKRLAMQTILSMYYKSSGTRDKEKHFTLSLKKLFLNLKFIAEVNIGFGL